MATKDDRPGLLSKVAMFVRNPTKDWSELEQSGESDANGYDKQALKAMIERKRQNDFVRKREFDQLRKLRDRDPGTMASIERHSFFQNSLPSDLGGRAVTLKKIDEIEAQMSRQWWKSKHEEGAAPAGGLTQGAATLAPTDPSVSSDQLNDSDLSAPFAVTEPLSLRRDGADFADEFIPTQMATEMASVSGQSPLDKPALRSELNRSFSTSELFAIEDDALEADPELEEGAIRFANSDDAGAEKGLLAALRTDATATPLSHARAAALLDLYRATDNRPGFEAAFYEFAVQLDGARPAWYALDDKAAQSLPAARPAQPGARTWICPAQLTAQAMDSLRLAMVSRPMPWYLGWEGLDCIAPDAVPLLDAVFGSLCEEAVTLRFDGEDRLVHALRALTPSGKREVPQACWQLRLNALRCMGMQDDFELAALDFCVTYGAVPPAWAQARCHFAGSHSASGTATAPGLGDAEPPKAQAPELGAPALVLHGQVMGDATQALSVLHGAPTGEQELLISCRELIRVDFAAAGGILNWVVMRRSEGRQVQFVDVHRLVAAFFNVIGINEHAKVVLRPL
jgi:hypothetical protein